MSTSIPKHPARDDAAKALTATQGNGVKALPKSAPARGRRARANAEDVRPLNPVRSIAGLRSRIFSCRWRR
jgi:hypothetical protein